MGDVYAGLDETLQRRVALKAIQADHRLNTESQERFLREARILSQLDHPNICRAYDYIEGEDSDWLVMELVDGRSLADRLKQGPLGPEVTAIASQIAGVLVVTHAAGIVHRDLKPGNVTITSSGDAKYWTSASRVREVRQRHRSRSHRARLLQRPRTRPRTTTPRARLIGSLYQRALQMKRVSRRASI